MLAGIVKVLIGMLLLVFAITSVQPKNYRVERSVVINSTAEKVFSHISILDVWENWSPWMKRDPKMFVGYSDNTSGVGAFATWESKTEGKGKRTITGVVENESLNMDLEFFAPWEGKATADFKITDVTESSLKLTWGVNGVNKNYIERFFFLVMSVRKMIGVDFEDGLASIKQLSE